MGNSFRSLSEQSPILRVLEPSEAFRGYRLLRVAATALRSRLTWIVHVLLREIQPEDP